MNQSMFGLVVRAGNRSRRALFVLALAAATAPPAAAIDVYYDFEGDVGTTVTDKLPGDGVADGTLQNNVALTTTGVPFGAQAIDFNVTPIPATLDQYTSLELPGTLDLGNAFTLSAFVDFSNTGLTRLFSNFGGTGSTVGSVLLDINRSAVSNQLRFIVNGQTTNNTSFPVGGISTGYHHIAATYNDGVPALYIDGVDVGTSAAFAGGINVTSPQNLRFGEDPHHVGGAGNEQFNGHVDDLMVVNRVLNAGEIASVAAQGVAAGYTSAGETLAIHYSFEGDAGASIGDKLVGDGAQNAIAHQLAAVDPNAAAAALGQQSGLFTPVPTANLLPLSRLNLGPLGELGTSFTIAAVVNMDSAGQTGNALARIFSTYQGSGGTAGKLIFDANPNPTSIGMRVILPNGQSLTSPEGFTIGEDHLMAFTYDNGELKIYLDGVERAAATGAGGSINLGAFSLFVGEDSAGGINEQLVGTVDDVLILGRALSASEMVQLNALGADAFLSIPEPATGTIAALAIAGAAGGLARRRLRNPRRRR